MAAVHSAATLFWVALAARDRRSSLPTKRVAPRLIEYDPLYCDTIGRRFTAYTDKPFLFGDGQGSRDRCEAASSGHRSQTPRDDHVRRTGQGAFQSLGTFASPASKITL